MTMPNRTISGRFATEFGQTLIRPPKVVLGVIACVVFAISGFTLSAVDEKYVSEIRWGDDRSDTYGSATSRILSLKASYSTDQPVIALVSHSAARDAVSDSEILVGIAREQLDDESTAFLNFTAGAISLWEILGISEVLSKKAKGIVVISISPNMFCRGIDELKPITLNQRLGLRSRLLDDALREIEVVRPFETGWYVVDNYRFVLARRKAILERAFYGANEPNQKLVNVIHEKESGCTAKSIEIRCDRMRREFLGNYYNESAHNFGLLRKAIDVLVENRRFKVILLEAPYNPLAKQLIYSIPSYAVLLDDYHDRVKLLCKDYAITYADINEKAALVWSDFIDDFHLCNADARARYTSELSQYLSRLELRN